MRNYTSAAKQNLLATSADEPFLILLEITHTDLASPIRVVNDVQNIVVDGDTYVAMPFRVTLPDDVKGQMPQAKLEVDNIGRELTQWLEVSGGGQGAKCKIMQVLRPTATLYAVDYFLEDYTSAVDYFVEFEITLDLTNLSITNEVVSGQLGFVNTLGRISTVSNFTPASSPGLW